MTTVSLTLPSDGQTIDAADVNNPFNAIAAVINGGVDSTNITAGGVTPNSLTSGTGTGWAWSSWTPTLSGLFTDAKWTKTCTYTQIGKTVHFKMKLVANNTSPMAGAGDAAFTLPVTAVSFAGGDKNYVCGSGGIYDSGTTLYNALPIITSTTGGVIRTAIAAAMSSTVPMTWTTSDEIVVAGTYEAA